jgi:hypothetical protein
MNERTAEQIQDEATVERLINLIDGHRWLADGRGPYAYNDGRYDDEVMAFVASLVEVLPAGRWHPWQTWLDHADRIKAALYRAREEGLSDELTDEIDRLLGDQKVPEIPRYEP